MVCYIDEWLPPPRTVSLCSTPPFRFASWSSVFVAGSLSLRGLRSLCSLRPLPPFPTWSATTCLRRAPPPTPVRGWTGLSGASCRSSNIVAPLISASWSSIFGPFCSSPTTLLLLSPLFLLHGQAFSALSAQAPTKKTWGYNVFGLFCFIMKSKNSQPKPAISIFAAGNCQRYESRYEKHQAPTQ
jgi:hypothetical protein